MDEKWHRKIWKPILGPIWAVCDPVTKVCKPALVQHWDRKYKHHGGLAPAVLIFDLVLLSLLGMVVVGGIFALFVLPAFPKPGIVSLQIDPPAEVRSGDTAETSVPVSFSNATGKILGCAVLRVRLPEMFKSSWDSNAQPTTPCGQGSPVEQENLTNEENFEVHYVGDIAIDQSATLTLKGHSYGKPGEIESTYAELFFWEEGKSHPSRVAARTEWVVADSTLDLSITTEPNLVRGRLSTITITYKVAADRQVEIASGLPPADPRKDSGVGFEALNITLEAPADFRMAGSSPAVTAPNLWLLENVEAGSEGKITVTGYLRSSRAPSAPVFTARAFDPLDGGGWLLNEARVNADARATGFALTQDLTTTLTPTLLPGQSEQVTVRYHNGGTQALKDVRVFLDADIAVIESPSPAELRWDAKSTPSLAIVEPGASGELTATFRVRSEFKPGVFGTESPALNISARAEYFLEDDVTSPVRTETDVEIIPISSLLGIKAAAFYYTTDGEQLGVGPLPPKAHEVTKYRIVVNVTNTINPIGDAWFEAYLPENVAWTGRYSVTAGESMDYFASTGRVRWKVGTIPAYADGTTERVGASFEVALTPTSEDVGTVPVLVRGIVVSGVDEATGAKLSASGGELSTELPFDPKADGKGVVQE